MGRHPIDSRFGMFVAGAIPVRRASMSSSVAHGSTSTVCRHDSGMQRTMEDLSGEGRDGTQHHRSANEDGRSRLEVRREDGAGCILGFMG